MGQRVRVSWTTTAVANWEAVIELEDGTDPEDLWDGDAPALIAFEDAYQAEHGLNVDEFTRETSDIDECPGHPAEDMAGHERIGFGIGDTVECDGRCLPTGMEKQVAAWDVKRRTALIREQLQQPVLVVIDADCPGCGKGERSFDPARGVFACGSLGGGPCGYESTERDA
jgi:hypothetical protein